MKDIDMQVLKYARELEAYDRGKHSQLEQFNSEEFCSKSLPFKRQYTNKQAMRRRRRKRVEDTVDVATYMSQHNLFSYLGKPSSQFFILVFFFLPSLYNFWFVIYCRK